MEGLNLNLVLVSWFMVAYLVPQEEMEAWVKQQVEAWSHVVTVLGKISWRHPQSLTPSAISYEPKIKISKVQ